MKNRILWGVTILPLVVVLSVMKFLPDDLPTHYDINGNIDTWGSKYNKLIFPIIIIALTLVWKLLIRYFEKKSINALGEKERIEAAGNVKVLYIVVICETIIFNIMCYTFLISACLEVRNSSNTMNIDINTVMNVVYGFLFIICGNFLPKCKRNGVVGLRTPWSIKNDAAWAKSQRWGGIILVVSGLLIWLVNALIGGLTATIIMVGLLLLFAILAFPLSYVAWKRSDSEADLNKM